MALAEILMPEMRLRKSVHGSSGIRQYRKFINDLHKRPERFEQTAKAGS
jgi:hypothetical protein